jgi:hypothetical protein
VQFPEFSYLIFEFSDTSRKVIDHVFHPFKTTMKEYKNIVVVYRGAGFPPAILYLGPFLISRPWI